MITSLTFLYLFLFFISYTYSLREIPAYEAGNNYITPLTVDEVEILNIIDTGSSDIVLYKESLDNLPDSYRVCQDLYLDATYHALQFINNPNTLCAYNESLASVANSNPLVIQTIPTSYLYTKNQKLHNWTESNGNFGFAYCAAYSYSYCSPSSFRKMLWEISLEEAEEGGYVAENSIFGLDFLKANAPIATVVGESSVQLSGVSPTYESTIVWQEQPLDVPVEHLGSIDSLEFCGQSLFGNFSGNWEVLFDTGSVCLSLPGEFYDSFISWFNTTNEVTSLSELPTITFEFQGEKFYLPLSLLVLDNDDFDTEITPSFLYYDSSIDYTTIKKLCVVKSSNIKDPNGKYYDYPPRVTFGSLTLQSLYFAADFYKGSLGLANKLSETDIQQLESSVSMCSIRSICRGDQLYDLSKNECKDPKCSDYFFTKLDSDTMTCVYNKGAYGVGLAFIIIFVLFEVISYFVLQYISHDVSTTNTSPSVVNHFDAITLWISDYVIIIFDKLSSCMMLFWKIDDEEHQRLLPNNNNNPNNV